MGTPNGVFLSFQTKRQDPVIGMRVHIPTNVIIALSGAAIGIVKHKRMLLHSLPGRSVKHANARCSCGGIKGMTLQSRNRQKAIVMFDNLSFQPSGNPSLQVYFHKMTPIHGKVGHFRTVCAASGPRMLRDPITITSLRNVAAITSLMHAPLHSFACHPKRRCACTSFS